MINIKTFVKTRRNSWTHKEEEFEVYEVYMHDILIMQTDCEEEALSMAKNLSEASGFEIVNTVARKWKVCQSYVFADTEEEALAQISLIRC